MSVQDIILGASNSFLSISHSQEEFTSSFLHIHTPIVYVCIHVHYDDTTPLRQIHFNVLPFRLVFGCTLQI